MYRTQNLMPYQRREYVPNFDEVKGNITIKPGRKKQQCHLTFNFLIWKMLIKNEKGQ